MTDIDEFFNRIKSRYPFFIPLFNDLFKDLDGFDEVFEDFEHEMNTDLAKMITRLNQKV